MATTCVLIAAFCVTVVHCQPFPDWLVTRITTPTNLYHLGSGRYRLTNGLISRDFVTKPDFATIDYYSHERKQSLLRAIRLIIYCYVEKNCHNFLHCSLCSINLSREMCLSPLTVHVCSRLTV